MEKGPGDEIQEMMGILNDARYQEALALISEADAYGEGSRRFFIGGEIDASHCQALRDHIKEVLDATGRSGLYQVELEDEPILEVNEIPKVSVVVTKIQS